MTIHMIYAIIHVTIYIIYMKLACYFCNLKKLLFYGVQKCLPKVFILEMCPTTETVTLFIMLLKNLFTQDDNSTFTALTRCQKQQLHSFLHVHEIYLFLPFF